MSTLGTCRYCNGKMADGLEVCPHCLTTLRMPLPDLRDPVECVLLMAVATSMIGIAITYFTNSPMAGSIANLFGVVLIVVVLPIAFGVNVGKNRSCGALGGARLCGLLSFLGLIILVCLPIIGDVECPNCRERVFLSDTTCRHCRATLRVG